MSDDLDTLLGLRDKVMDRSGRMRRNENYYNGVLRLAALGMALPPEMRALQTVVNWPRLAVDALQERIDLTGFRMTGTDQPDDRLWGWWQANRLDVDSDQCHLEALIHGRAFVTVGYNEDDPSTPIITCESAKNMTLDIDPRTKTVTSAARLYDFNPGGEAESATLYLPDRTVYYARLQGRWIETEVIEHNYGQVPIVPMVNRGRLGQRLGDSEMIDVIPLTDACCRALTNLQGAQELLAVPSRYVFGLDAEDMKDQDGNQVNVWEAYIGRYNVFKDPEASVVQLPAAELANFTIVIDSYAKLVASQTGMPPHFLGLSTDNPASADAIRSAEARHVKKAAAKIKAFGAVWEDVMRLALKVVDGSVPDKAQRMEAIFADPATPTQAQTTDSVIKLVQTGILPIEAAWEELGYSTEKQARLRQLRTAQLQADQAAAADQLMTAAGVPTRLTTTAAPAV